MNLLFAEREEARVKGFDKKGINILIMKKLKTNDNTMW